LLVSATSLWATEDPLWKDNKLIPEQPFPARVLGVFSGGEEVQLLLHEIGGTGRLCFAEVTPEKLSIDVLNKDMSDVDKYRRQYPDSQASDYFAHATGFGLFGWTFVSPPVPVSEFNWHHGKLPIGSKVGESDLLHAAWKFKQQAEVAIPAYLAAIEKSLAASGLLGRYPGLHLGPGRYSSHSFRAEYRTKEYRVPVHSIVARPGPPDWRLEVGPDLDGIIIEVSFMQRPRISDQMSFPYHNRLNLDAFGSTKPRINIRDYSGPWNVYRCRTLLEDHDIEVRIRVETNDSTPSALIQEMFSPFAAAFGNERQTPMGLFD
jgi:hypothetical protein